MELAYKKWISIPSDLRMIGVASPGVGLNLMVLTSALKDRYLRTQTVLYPVVEKIRTFAEVNSFYLAYLQVWLWLVYSSILFVAWPVRGKIEIDAWYPHIRGGTA